MSPISTQTRPPFLWPYSGSQSGLESSKAWLGLEGPLPVWHSDMASNLVLVLGQGPQLLSLWAFPQGYLPLRNQSKRPRPKPQRFLWLSGRCHSLPLPTHSAGHRGQPWFSVGSGKTTQKQEPSKAVCWYFKDSFRNRLWQNWIRHFSSSFWIFTSKC